MRKFHVDRFLFEVVFPVFIGVFFIGLILTVGAQMYDSYNEYRAQTASITCEQNRMVPRRYFLTDSVVCVPVKTRNDSLTIMK